MFAICSYLFLELHRHLWQASQKKCVTNSSQHLDLLFHEVHQEKIFRCIYDRLSMIAFCCENQCKQTLHLYTAPCLYFDWCF